jgi:uncharacterized tellurite resistance protein B-like protein
MGFFGDLLGGGDDRPVNLSKQEAFLGVLFSVMSIDGNISGEEVNDLISYLSRSKTFKSVDQKQFQAMIEKINKIMRKEGPLKLAEKSADALPENMREGTFALACDMLFADGVVEKEELQLMDMLKVRLAVSDVKAQQIVEVMKVKASV